MVKARDRSGVWVQMLVDGLMWFGTIAEALVRLSFGIG